VLASFSFIRQ